MTYSYIGQVRNIWILGENRQKILWRINLIGAVLNILLNFAIIPIWGIVGAAFTSFATQFFTNFLLGFIIKPIRDCNKLMLRGLNPKFVCNEIMKIVKR